MKQLVQDLRTGETSLLEIPVPRVKKGYVLIKTQKSLVSAGTERMLVEFGKANWIGKVRQQPERVKLILQKIKSDGILFVLKAVLRKLNQPITLGYCNVGIVLEVGDDISDIKIGDRVASNGSHAEVVCIARNLVAKIPEQVTDSEATFTVIGSVALNSINLLNPFAGDTVAVIGAGLIGLLIIDLLLNRGCRVIAIDVNEDKLKIARSKNVITCNSAKGSVEHFVMSMTANVGVNGVIITANSNSHLIISQAAKMSRMHGKIVLVGVTGLSIIRSDFQINEVQFQVVDGYGQRSEKSTKSKYPDANQNFKEILDLILLGKLDVKSLVTQTVPFQNFDIIYRNITSSKSIASILDYSDEIDYQTIVKHNKPDFVKRSCIIGIIGAGNFTSATLLPILKNNQLKYIASESGLSGAVLAKKYNIPYCTSDYQEILNDEEIDLVLITTRHHLHAQMVMNSLKTGKHVFVEKPLALWPEELDEIIEIYTNPEITKGSLTVGFNRRFAPHVQKMKLLLGRAPMNVIATMNAGFIPADSWVHDRKVGGGRIIGEACHFIDLVTYLTGSRITSVCMNVMGLNASETSDNGTILLKYENGSMGTINYFSNGNKEYSKERIEVYSLERTLVLDNFKTLSGFGFIGFSKMNISQNKGHKEQFKRLLESVKSGGESIIPFDEILNVTKATFAALESLETNSWIKI